MRPLLTLCPLLLFACGPAAPTATCAGMVSGQLMGTFSVCNEFDQRYRQNLDNYNFTATYTELPTSFTFATEWVLKGEPKVQSYNQDTRDVQCSITMKKGNLTWLGRKGNGVPTSGTCTLTFDSIDDANNAGNVTTYKVKGKLQSHLEAEPGTGSTGTVEVSMDFEG